MRQSLLLVCLFSALMCFSQFNETAYGCRRDVIISQTNYGSVYITRDHNCDLYKWLCPDPLEWLINSEIEINFPELAPFISLQQSQEFFPSYWNELHTYQDEYFVYGPSDWMANRPEYILDSFLVEIASDFTYFRILKKELVTAHELMLTLDRYGEQTLLRIRLLSFPKGAAVWEYSSNNKSWTELKVASDYIRTYDMINNDCVEQKCFQEFKFDAIDPSRLVLMDK